MINGVLLKNAIISGANNIVRHKKEVDELNIFPVPDGDTGTNMSMTITAAAKLLAESEEGISVAEVSKMTSSAMLRGARGNSGVILSLLFKGIAEVLKESEEVDGVLFADALTLGVEYAYKAVMNPTEGTILTVARLAAEAARIAADVENDPIIVLGAVCNAAEDALTQTPELLHVLKKAGVVDAGGKGLCIIFEGMLSLLRDGVMINIDAPVEVKKENTDDFFKNAAAEFDSEINFTYCTEFIVGKNDNATADSVAELRAYLEGIGDCVVVVEDDDIIKTHVHTENPGLALETALKYGQLLTVKVENMREQHRIAAEKHEQELKLLEESPEPAEPEKEFGFVSVAAGEGLYELFKDLGVDRVVSGGQSMNPSTENLYNAIMAVPAKVVFVFPNNKNILMAARQACELITDRKTVIIPTRTVPQGIAAMLAYDEQATVELNIEYMMEAAKKILTGQVTYAARDSEFGSTKLREGDIIALNNGKLVFKDKDPVKAAIKLTKEMVSKSTTFITIIYGEKVSEAQANLAYDAIQAKYGSSVDITLVNGGQPLYYFLISVE
ncbi:dAK2 domain fusion protein YloV [Clostridium sp. CAG:352]|uniref:DAK2 domain-containing protein n=1 Tax=Pseudoruminococcus massiliensis TaxID=2086583 RepID=UPI00033EFE55|nr:dAK2 domain fusion protein YloV [Clostridium sp. CAG:352]SCJ53882.1 dihydroxyacetone kinase [uncultured Ruminococcus sp.]SCJ56710.1 dihydroxyacetone kinase [uncultured Ruminococcus sp.]